ncbi:hypothetical protein [Limnochorda pilosa]|uniref:Uncharacterized protein n=1 Tax=Limnochorda pilosa TaxID=1555112 RepID=A0A0K2SLL8_LIMPI|nr:hypothetical protein [Limnochorda pilosa]BAS28021.1 hypothetical protein LIP_2180 [Limnochorda pilosa]
MNVLRRLVGAVLVLTVLAGLVVALSNTAFAAKDHDENIVVEARLAPSLLRLNTSPLARFTYDLQEGIHELLKRGTGISVPHSYLEIRLNGRGVAYIDPPAVYDFD